MVENKTRLIRFNGLAKLDKNHISIVILTTLTALQLLLYWRYLHDLNSVLIQAIFIIGICWQTYQKQRQLKLVRDLAGSLLGISLIFLLLFRAKYIFLVEASVFSYFSPWLALIGYILLIAGLRGIKQYHREIVVCIVITIIPGLSAILSRINQPNAAGPYSLEVISAKLSSFLLWYLGFDSTTQGTLVYVNNGAINIYWACTAAPIIFQLCRFSLIMILLFSGLCRNTWLPFILSFVIGFALSIVRLVMMALAVNDTAAFHFWHGVQGGNVFMTSGLVIFLSVILVTSPPHNINPSASPSPYQPQTPTWLLLSSSVALLFILYNFIIGSPPLAGANQIANYQLPSEIPLPDWQIQQTTTQPLIPLIEDVNLPPDLTETAFDRPIDQRFYVYRKDNDELALSLRYIVNTLGDIKSYYLSFRTLSQVKNSTEIKHNDSYYLKFVDKGKEYWATCLNVEGKTTITDSQFLASLAQEATKPAKFWDWMLGKRPIRDRRCLWIELSTPEDSTLTDADKMKVWQSIVDYWRSHFPPLRPSNA